MSKVIDENILIDSVFKTYDINQLAKYTLNISAKQSGSLFVRVEKADSVSVKCIIDNGYDVNIIFWNQSDCEIVFDEQYTVNNNGNLNLSYGECNKGKTERDTKVELIGAYTNAILNSASLVSTDKNYRIKMINSHSNTSGQINNHAVVLNNGRLMIDAIGKINKGAKKSKSHQTSRALSFADNQNTTILPELLIDENDVEASHAMSIGRVDEEHLYYMMSRGLDMNECTRLISLGYLLPITDNISDDKLRDALKEELERKINEYVRS